MMPVSDQLALGILGLDGPPRSPVGWATIQQLAREVLLADDPRRDEEEVADHEDGPECPHQCGLMVADLEGDVDEAGVFVPHTPERPVWVCPSCCYAIERYQGGDD